MRRLLLLSNSTSYGEAFLEFPKPYIKAFLTDTIQEVAFLPYAGVTIDHDKYSESVSEKFQSMGYQLRGLHEAPNPSGWLSQAQAIVVGGGNTFQLLKSIYDLELVDVIRERVAAGVPYIGWSAGSNLAGPTIKTTNDMPVVEPPSFEALNLVPFQINPHYTEATIPNHGGESRATRLAEFLKVNPGKIVVGLREGSGLLIEGSEIKLVGGKNTKIFQAGKKVLQLDENDDLNFLLVS